MRIAFSILLLTLPLDAAAVPDFQTITLAGAIPPPSNIALKQYLTGVNAVAYDSQGALYYSDGQAIWRLNQDGSATQITASVRQGLPAPRLVGERGNVVAAMAFDGHQNLYIADAYDLLVRKISSDLTISTFAGTGQFPAGASNAGPGVTATQVSMLPQGLAVDAGGTVYVTDSTSGSILSISPDGQTTKVVAGNNSGNSPGDGGPATHATLLFPGSLAIGGNLLYVVDEGNEEIRQISLQTGIITQVVDGSSPAASGTYLGISSGLAVSPDGSVYAAGNRGVWKINPITLVFQRTIGNGLPGNSGDGAPAANARLKYPSDVAVNGRGDVAIADLLADNVRVVDASTLDIQTVAGLAHFSGDNGPAPLALIDGPNCTAVDSSGNLYFADINNARIREIMPNGTIVTVAGNGVAGFSGDSGPAIAAELNLAPTLNGLGNCLAVDRQGNLYIQDTSNSRIRRVDRQGNISTIAGGGSVSFPDHIDPLAAQIQPGAIAVDPSGNLFIMEFADILEISGGTIFVIAGDGENPAYSGENTPAKNAQLSGGQCMATDAAGDLFFCDDTSRVRKIDTNGIIRTVAGNGQFPKFGDPLPTGPAISTPISQPLALAVGPAGDLYIHGGITTQIAYVDTAGNLSPIAGKPGDISFTDAGDGGDALKAGFSSFNALAVDSQGDVFIADGETHIRELLLIGPSGQPPFVNAGGVVGAGGSLPPVTAVSSGGLATIFGNYFIAAGTFHILGAPDLANGKVPTNLAGVCATIGGSPVALTSVFPGQLNVQVPQLPAGPALVQVTVNCGSANAVVSNFGAVMVQAASPEFFSFAPDPVAGHNPIAAVNPVTHALTGPTGLIPGVTLTPAKPGDYVEAYGTGWGATNPALGLGVLPGGAFNLAAQYSVTLGGVPLPAANILYAGASPCCAGLMQLDFQIPLGTSSGNQSLVITVGGAPSPSGAYIPIQ